MRSGGSRTRARGSWAQSWCSSAPRWSRSRWPWEVRRMRIPGIVALALMLFAPFSIAQEAADADASSPTTQPVAEANERAWSFSLSAFTYFVPDDHEYVQPTLTADRDS